MYTIMSPCYINDCIQYFSYRTKTNQPLVMSIIFIFDLIMAGSFFTCLFTLASADIWYQLIFGNTFGQGPILIWINSIQCVYFSKRSHDFIPFVSLESKVVEIVSCEPCGVNPAFVPLRIWEVPLKPRVLFFSAPCISYPKVRFMCLGADGKKEF